MLPRAASKPKLTTSQAHARAAGRRAAAAAAAAVVDKTQPGNAQAYKLLSHQTRLEAAMADHQQNLAAESPSVQPYDTPLAPDQTIAVAFRVRPLLPTEVNERKLFAGIHVRNPTTVVYHPVESTFSSLALETHCFDNVDVSFGPDADNATVYATLAQPLLPFVVDQGGLATLIAYGQTGAGKTFTMTSLHQQLPQDIFPTFSSTHFVTVAYFELYGDDVTDLLNERAPLTIRSQPESGSTVVFGATNVEVQSAGEFLAAVELGAEYRRTRATFKNDVSSRSHAVCAIQFHSRQNPDLVFDDETGEFVPPTSLTLGESTLLIVDLAGSERASDQLHHDAIRIKETQLTNKSLMTLKECIRARYLASLAATSDGTTRKPQHVHIPFRQSKLTLALKEALDPTSTLPTRTIMVGHLAPSLADSQHSLSTARYVANLKASSMDHADSAVKARIHAPSTATTASAHPSKWTYKQLVRKFALWSNNTINLELIVPFVKSGGTLAEIEARNANYGGHGLPPPWIQIQLMSAEEWVLRCAKIGVTRETALKAFQKYTVELASGRVQAKAAKERTGIVTVQ
ncbi:P-loop containing nucleoside triphosphate hydrolase protein [Blastocladiella britannica]|nr:P-loop containing nucleoside triphosphate hydrolase protein [Blastocladiella britannica]